MGAKKLFRDYFMHLIEIGAEINEMMISTPAMTSDSKVNK